MLEDSGWYYPDYNLAQIPLLQRSAGPQWFEDACYNNETKIYPDPFSRLLNYGFVCGGLGNSKGLYAIPGHGFADSCNMAADIVNCYWVKSKIPGINSVYDQITFETYNNENSRCFSNYYDAYCFEVISCAEGLITFKVGTDTYVCKNEGDIIRLPILKGLSIDEYVICPKFDYICKETSCLNMCNGKGYCKNSKCVCFEGYSGSDCSKLCDKSCKECAPGNPACISCEEGFNIKNNICVYCDFNCKTCLNSATHCTSCSNGKYLAGDQCLLCDPGYYLIDTVCLICDSNCKTCSNSATYCTSCSNTQYLEVNQFDGVPSSH